MSWLVFKRTVGKIYLVEGYHPKNNRVSRVKASWPAHNEVTTNSHGICPNGVWPWTHYNAHSETGLRPACYKTAYGCDGIHVFKVPSRTGIGVHSGRTKGEPGILGGKTLGCIRVPPEAIEYINKIHNKDPIEVIVVTN